MKIIHDPKNWKDLQNKVGEILSQCNFGVEIEHVVESARSKIEIDVYAEEVIHGRRNKILCECKMWESNIPQLYIHGFRTVLNDVGANKGYIITTSNFQKGAKISSEFTNVELCTWPEFQKEFFESWYFNFFSIELGSILYNDYSSTAIAFYDDFSKIEKDKFRILIDKYEALMTVNNHFPSHTLKDYPELMKDISELLPLKDNLEIEPWELENINLPEEILEECYYSNFLKLISQFAMPIFKRLDELELTVDYD